MNWQYRTILFEYQKDGLLGDKYIDDEELEKTLNDQGNEGWELVAVTPVQEGLLAFLKRLLPRRGTMREKEDVSPARPSQEIPEQDSRAERLPGVVEGKAGKKSPPGKTGIGEIKIL